MAARTNHENGITPAHETIMIFPIVDRPLGGQPGHRPGLHFEKRGALGPAERVWLWG